MAPALLVDVRLEASRHPWGLAVRWRVAPRTGCAGRAAVAGVWSFPGPASVLLANPSAVFAEIARHLAARVFAFPLIERPNRLAIVRTASGFLPVLLRWSQGPTFSPARLADVLRKMSGLYVLARWPFGVFLRHPQPLHGEFVVVALKVPPTFHRGFVSILGKTFKIIARHRPGGLHFQGVLLADVWVARLDPSWKPPVGSMPGVRSS
jgi:hypothetical protein